MKCYFTKIFFFCICLFPLYGNDTFSKERLVDFHEEFTSEQKNKLIEAGLISSSSFPVSSTSPFAPPPDPPPPPLIANHLPIVIVNNSGLHDSEVFIVMTIGSTQFMEFDSGTGIGTLQAAVLGQNPKLYNKSLFNLPAGSTGRVIYLPQDATVALNSANLWFSVSESLSIEVNAGGIAQPSPTDLTPSNPNRYISFDFFEITINPQNSPPAVAMVFADLTAVTDFSIPLYGFLSTPNSSPSPNHPDPSHMGFFQPQSYIFNHAATTFNSAPESAQWNKLVIRDLSNKIVRILSTQKSISISPAAPSADSFSFEYLNPSAGYNYISDILSYYTTNTLTIETPPVGVFPAITFSGNTSGTSIVLNSTSYGDMTIPLNSPTITFDIFSSNGPAITGTADPSVQTELNKIFTQSIIIGFIPTTVTLTKPFLNLASTRANFYKFNSNLSTTSQTGPWYDLYSKPLHQLATIYTSGFDDEIYPSVLLVSQTIETAPTPTYIGITIGNVTD